MMPTLPPKHRLGCDADPHEASEDADAADVPTRPECRRGGSAAAAGTAGEACAAGYKRCCQLETCPSRLSQPCRIMSSCRSIDAMSAWSLSTRFCTAHIIHTHTLITGNPEGSRACEAGCFVAGIADTTSEACSVNTGRVQCSG